ncbi:SDR family NAD(P)-dependent oxidoreductase [Nannocystis sp. SCPEA4]|jgi:NAD(P)-dependent dehydrogenase (short-subunit alcohol dehydrogenase family)|uniref:SDR family NAD(P)-dependent oxidoreductase n=1 Tax=Nannocystis sp. SCPEA4 TaxID=2996787 RepID=UPI00227062C7|nr:SDR family NAD(P)-dependent oxidoreductase [Nannocystis sp. SCPEA4]MCY1061355.1 SDR family NAD(P)-dependent oxidoreductase [Nannocystis sp. SCPEA4]
MQRDLEGLTIVVTGGAGALGGAVVQELVDAGAAVVVPAIDAGPAEPVAGVRYLPRVDLSQETAVEAVYAGLPSLWASVHLAGGFTWAKVEDTTLATVQAQWTLNAVTAFLCSRAAVAKIRATGKQGGRIVNTVARAVLQPAAGLAAYTMAKAAVAALTAQMAEELRDEGINVNAIAPGLIDTPANRKAMPDADPSRWTKPAEIARTVHALVSPALSVTSGAIVPVYGRS